jgi:4-amino-4-deoxy-L-arabinose transferase-like glycosyltransferase
MGENSTEAARKSMKNEKYFLIFLTAIAIVTRLINISNKPLWADEEGAINTVNILSMDLLINWWDNHPFGYYFLLWPFIQLFGENILILRLISVTFSVLTIIGTYILGKKLYNKKLGQFASILLTFNFTFLFRSQEIRMYTVSAFFFVLFSIYLLNTLDDYSKKNFLKYALCGILMINFEFMGLFLMLFHAFFVLFYLKGEKLLSGRIRNNFILTYVIIFFAFLPYAFNATENVSGLWWVEEISWEVFMRSTNLAFGIYYGKNALIVNYLFLFLIIGVCSGISYDAINYWFLIKKLEKKSLSIFLASSPLCLILFSLLVISIYMERYLSPFTPFFSILFIAGINYYQSKIKSNNVKRMLWVVFIIFFVFNIYACVIYYQLPEFY